MNRRSRPFAAMLVVLALLFAQAMVSVHACDQVGGAKASTAAMAVSHPDGDCCDHGAPQPDPACDNHCQQGKQVAERGQASSVMPPVALGFAMPAAVALPQAPPAFTLPAPDLARGTQPSIPIRNCCFRI